MSDNTIPFRCKIGTSDPSAALDLEILLDGTRIYYNPHVKEDVEFEHNVEDADDTEHELVFVMTSKTSDFTKIDESGNIVSDAMLSITNLSMDDIDISQLFVEKNTYVHDFNGSQPEIVDQFFQDLGCNGRITFKFSTPFYLWLLESM